MHCNNIIGKLYDFNNSFLEKVTPKYLLNINIYLKLPTGDMSVFKIKKCDENYNVNIFLPFLDEIEKYYNRNLSAIIGGNYDLEVSDGLNKICMFRILDEI